jgi:hypothetical protein
MYEKGWCGKSAGPQKEKQKDRTQYRHENIGEGIYCMEMIKEGTYS